MKRKSLKILIVTMFLLLFSVNSFAVTYEYTGKDIYDNAELFSSDVENEITEKIKKLEEKYEYDIAVVTVWENSVTTPQTFADRIYDESNMGFGPHNTGILLVINMGTRDITLSSSEPNQYYVFTQKALDKIRTRVGSELTDENYDGALRLFVKMIKPYIEEGYGKANNSFGYTIKKSFFSIWTVFASVIAFLVWMLPKFISHRPVKLASEAGSYIVAGTYNINSKKDRFLHTHTTKHKIETSSSGSGRSGGGGGGTHRGGSTGKF